MHSWQDSRPHHPIARSSALRGPQHFRRAWQGRALHASDGIDISLGMDRR